MISQQFHPLGKDALLQIISDPFLCITYSQYGEDTLIAEFLSGNALLNRPKFYVDIGAYHPSRFSNTKLLRFLGWRGINVDPNPDSIKLFQEARPSDINLNVGISTKSGHANLYCFQEGAMNTFDKESAETLVRKGWAFLGPRKVPLMQINELLDTYLPDDVKKYGIGFLDIDCEGLDAEIIESFDIGKYNPLILAIEANGFDPQKPDNNIIYQKVIDRGYVLGAYLGPTLLFWKKNPDL
ncbi:MAG: FkbM family methyltransferase [Flavobacteriia bacterium]